MLVDRDQLRAHRAFAFAAALVGEGDDRLRADFLNLARKLPAMLQTNGLLAAWSFLRAKETNERARALEALRQHLRAPELRLGDALARLEGIFPQAPQSAGSDELSGTDLRRLTAEAIVYSGWLKRAAEAICDHEERAASANDRSPAGPPAEGGEG